MKKALEAVNDFKEVSHMELTLYNAAEKYLREHMGKHFDPSLPGEQMFINSRLAAIAFSIWRPEILLD